MKRWTIDRMHAGHYRITKTDGVVVEAVWFAVRLPVAGIVVATVT